MQLFADWHTHSFYSDGSMTPEAIVAAAVHRGLDEVAITDHGPRGIFIGVRAARVYRDLKAQAAWLAEKYAIRVLIGAEANVINLSGDLDIPGAVAGELDILIAGLHPQVWCRPFGQTLTWIVPNRLARYSERVREMLRGVNTRALAAAIYKHRLTFVSHPGLMMAVDLDEIARACSDRGCAMEVNCGHQYDRDRVIKAALKWGAPLVVNSDAHYPETVGDLAEGLALLEKNGVPPGQVLNARNNQGAPRLDLAATGNGYSNPLNSQSFLNVGKPSSKISHKS